MSRSIAREQRQQQHQHRPVDDPLPAVDSTQPGSPLLQDSAAMIPSETMAGRLSSLQVGDVPPGVAVQADPVGFPPLNMGVASDRSIDPVPNAQAADLLQSLQHGIPSNQDTEQVHPSVHSLQQGIPNTQVTEQVNPPVIQLPTGTVPVSLLSNTYPSESGAMYHGSAIIEDSASAWRTQRWERHRIRVRLKFNRPIGPDVAERQHTQEQGPQGEKLSLPYGIRRTSVGTWVTTAQGQSAFYSRRPMEFGQWNLDEEGNERNPFPSHSSFASTVDEDDYFIEHTSCTSNFSFTAHPEDYEYCRIDPPTSISIRRHTASLTDDVQFAWPLESGDEGNDALRDEQFYLQRDVMNNLAMTVDDIMDHLMEGFDRDRELGAQIVSARDEMDSGMLQLSYHLSSLDDMYTNLREEFTRMTDSTLADIRTVISDIETRVSLLETRVEAIPSTSPVPPLLAIRHSLAALENSTKLRLTNHAASLMESLARRRPRGSNRDNGGRTSGASGWSVASDSQLSVDAPADHVGEPLPMNIRGGGLVSTPTCYQGQDGLSRNPLQSGTVLNGDPELRVPPTSTPTGGCRPTPWSRGNEFSARENVANAARQCHEFSARENAANAARQCNTAVDMSTAFPGDAPADIFIHGHRYSQVNPDTTTVLPGLAPAMEPNQGTRCFQGYSKDSLPPGFPPAMELGQSTLLPSARKVSTLGKFWHGGGIAMSFITGVECLSTDQAVMLGVPELMAFMVVSTHNQIYSQWSRNNDRNGTRDRNGYGDTNRSPETHGRLFGPNHHEAIKHIGWPELPREGVTPERWVEFYTDLQLMSNYFNIGIMPFEALDLRYADGGHALCICGLGYSIFTKMGTSLFLIVQRLLPMSVPEISTKVQSVALNGGNGFELLWVLTKYFVPMVSTTKNLGWPVWPSTDDVFLFARRVSLYCTLSRMRGMKPYTDCQKSDLFLSNVGGVHREYAQHLLTSLHIHASSSIDGSLSAHLKLHISDLTERLMDRHRDDSRGSSLSSSLVNRVVAPAVRSPVVSSASAVDPHIQGYCVNVARVGSSVPRRAPVPKTTSARRSTPSSVRPPRYEGNCAACGKWGHQAATCDMLAMAVFLRKYSADKSNSRAIQDAEQAWMDKNKKWIPSTTAPRTLLTRYCDLVQLPVDQVDEELDWDLLCSSLDDSTQEDVDDPQLLCNRVEDISVPDPVDWFRLPAAASSAWFPQSFRIGLSPLIPPGSLLDTTTMDADMRGELHDPELRDSSDDEVDSSGDDSVDGLDSDDSTDNPFSGIVMPSGFDTMDDASRRRALLVAFQPFARQADVTQAFHVSRPADDIQLGRWEEAVNLEMSLMQAFHRLPMPEADLSQSVLVPDCGDSIVPSASACCRMPGYTLVDSGSNVCLTNDLSILDDVQDMEPRPLDVALDSVSTPPPTSMCTKFGFVSIRLLNGTLHRQKFLFNEAATETILSPEDIVRNSTVLRHWVQSGRGGASGDGCLLFSGSDEITVLLSLPLIKRNGLYYCSMSSSALASIRLESCNLINFSNNRDEPEPDPQVLRVNTVSRPVTKVEHLSSELWAARLGYCGSQQLALIPANTEGTPSKFRCHPLRFIDVKEEASIKRQPCSTVTAIAEANGSEFYMDFAFLRSSSSDFGDTPPISANDRVVQSFDGFYAHLLIVDKHSRRSWVFMRISKEPPTDIVEIFLTKYGRSNGGSIRCDQGGELARSEAFRTLCLSKGYLVEPTGADSPSQNGGAERWNGTLAVTVRSLLYGSGLPPKYWSAALSHAVYLHNRRVHMVTRRTPFEMWHGKKPNLTHLRVFGSRVYVKKTGDRPAKLDRHAFKGIFIGYTATDKNIRYIDVDSGMVKSSHHAVFDEAWYTQEERPPTAQLLYTLGLDCVDQPLSSPPDQIVEPSPEPLMTSLVNNDAKVIHEFGIDHRDLRQVYFSPSPYNAAFEESLSKRWFTESALKRHPHGGMSFQVINGRLILTSIEESAPFAMLPQWRSRLRGAWLIRVHDQDVVTQEQVATALQRAVGSNCVDILLLFSHPEIRHGLTSDGIPQITMDMMNPGARLGVAIPADIIPDTTTDSAYRVFDDGECRSLISNATRLTRGKLMKQPDWEEWSNAEKLQWDQYEEQGMLGTPIPLPTGSARFNIVWQYGVKHDGRKKARATCDGSSRGNVVRVLDHTYAGTPDHIGQRIFFAACAAENLVIYGSDASNAFAEASPPRQGINLHTDRSFREWWVWKGRPPLPDGYVVPLKSAMQGHPEAPRLWERHIDKILRSIGLVPTIHEPCLYSGIINGKRVLLLRQVDDFATASSDAATCDKVLDLIDVHLKIPLKRLGLVDTYNGVNIVQTKNFIKISCESYIDKICAKHLGSWMKAFVVPPRNPTPLPTTSGFMKSFLAAEGSPDTQVDLEKRMQLSYRSGVGELIYALVTCRPDISHAVVRCAQNCICPHEVHYHAVKHVLKYLFLTKSEGLYFWRETPNDNLPDTSPPVLSSTAHDLLMDGRPQHSSTSLHGYVDSDWATCPKTRRSMTGVCISLAGGTIAYKTKLQATVAQSSTEAEFMGASDFGKMMLYIRSILWDLGIPQHSASFLYEDNDACTAMAMAQKPTPRARHMDIKFYALCQWVERDLIKLERIDTTVNMADHFTKSLSPVLFRRHTDYIMGRVPPHYSRCHPVFRDGGFVSKRVVLDGSVSPAVHQLVSTWETIGASSLA